MLATSEESLADLNERLAAAGEEPVPMSRFRPNIVVAGSPAWAEDGWRDLRLPDAVLWMAKSCGRCVVTTTDQLTGERRGRQPLAMLARFRLVDKQMLFGVNLGVSTPGTIAVGDPISLG